MMKKSEAVGSFARGHTLLSGSGQAATLSGRRPITSNGRGRGLEVDERGGDKIEEGHKLFAGDVM